MKTPEYFHIEHYIKFSKPWNKKSGWAVWHGCFDCEHGCGSEYLVLGGVKSSGYMD
ncbi:hypothetical protein [Acinetobacter sp. G11]|uniref:hypothetical protein n=1 Tax=Acinetobacter sp. G11 TaxID=3415989 RepID=UPI003C7BAF6B